MPTSSSILMQDTDPSYLTNIIFTLDPQTAQTVPLTEDLLNALASGMVIPNAENDNNEVFINTTAPYLKFEIQPTDKFRFRYLSEKGSHGSITGVPMPRTKKTFPTVKLENFSSHQNILIKASLYTPDENPKLHLLTLVGKNCQNGACFQKLDKNFLAKFQNMSIVSKKKDEVLNILKERKLMEIGNTHLDENEVMKQVNEEAKTFNMNAAKLCFEAIFEGNLENPVPVPGCQRIFSNIIYNQKSTITGDLRICRLSRSSGKISGGDEVILLCDKIKKDDIKVEFFEKDDNGDTIWSEYAEFSPANVHHQVAIPFKTPKYDGVITDGSSEKTVHIQLFRPSDEKHGEPREFRYISDDDMRCSKKRRLPDPFEEFMSLNFTDDDLSLGDLSVNDNTLLQTTCFPVEDCFKNVQTLSEDTFGSESGSSTSESESHLYFLNLPDTVVKNAVKYSEDPKLQISSNFNNFQRKPNEIQDDSRIVAQMGCSMMPIINIPSIKNSEEKYEINHTNELSKLSMNINKLLRNKRILYYASKGVSVQDTDGNSLLHLAIMEQKHNIQFINQLLNVVSKEVVNHRNGNNETPLYLATSGNSLNIVKLLLQFNANPCIINVEGNTCFHLASKNNFSECLEELINSPFVDEKTDFRKSINSYNFDGLTPLHLSILHKSRDCFKLLLNAKVDTNLREMKCGRTAFHLAVQVQPSFIGDLLLQPHINVNIEDYRGYTALQTACEEVGEAYESLPEEIKSDRNEMLSFLMKLYADEDEEEEWSISNMYSYENGLSTSLRENFIDSAFEKKVLKLLNAKSYWRKLGVLADMDEKSLNILEKLDDNPAEALINKIKKTQKLGDTKEDFKNILIMAGLSKELNFIT